MEPVALAIVAGLTPPEWEIRLCDELQGDTPGDFRPDLVALSSLTPTAPHAYEIARFWRSRGVPVVMGGMHATLCPDEAARYVDCVYCGEAEGAWPLLVRDFESGQLKPRYQAGAVPLGGMPLPRRDLYGRKYRVTLVGASRGCRYRCEFCALWKFEAGHYRTRPVEDVLAELAVAPRGYITLFTDDNVYLDREHCLRLHHAMVERGLQRRHAVQASIDIADDDELLTALKASGCLVVLIGLESLSEATLKRMRKGVNLGVGADHYAEKIERLHSHGLMAAGTFIFASDGDGPDVFERTAAFVLDAGVDLAHFGLLVPTPGTDVFDRLQREGRLLLDELPQDYARLDPSRAAFRPEAMTPEQAEQGLVAARGRISSWPVALRRAGRTWHDTGSPAAALVSLLWTRTGLRGRVSGGKS